MPLHALCQQCGATLEVPESLLYKPVRCGYCGSVVVVNPLGTITPSAVPEQTSGGVGGSVAAMVLGIIGLVAWCIPLIGFPVNLIGFILGVVNVKQAEGRGMAIAGIVTSTIGLILTVINAILGAIIGMAWQQQLH